MMESCAVRIMSRCANRDGRLGSRQLIISPGVCGCHRAGSLPPQGCDTGVPVRLIQACKGQGAGVPPGDERLLGACGIRAAHGLNIGLPKTIFLFWPELAMTLSYTQPQAPKVLETARLRMRKAQELGQKVKADSLLQP